MGSIGGWESWIFQPIAFQKGILWSMLFEVLGLGCGSGPLTERYFPPIGGFLYFLRPGTTKLALYPKRPLLGGAKMVQLTLWFFAGFSKLNRHFPYVVGVMNSNSPFTRFEFLRKFMFKDYPRDLNPSRFARQHTPFRVGVQFC